ncbi:hypothetical protein, partial [Aliarcobacter cryaerophilus]|uniref:hypothetical protein n=1 Tax=Aliarcobacter cryaerophilus TaxID=28198 RepID=UPI0021B499B0
EFTPNTDYTGTTSFKYTANTSTGVAEEATVTVTVAPNTPPVVVNATVNVSEEGLVGGIKDNTGTSDTTDEKTVSGKISITDSDNANLTVTLQKPTQTLQAKDTDGVFKDIVWTGDNTKTLVGKVGDTEVIKVTIDDSGNYTVDLLAPVKHPINSVEDIVSIDFGVVANDGKVSTTGKLTVNIEDDMPTISDTDIVVWATKQEIPEIFTGNVNFAGSGGNHSSYSFANGAVLVTGKGFTSSTDLTLIDANINQNSGGLGVASTSSPYHNLAGEVDFRKTSDGQGASEELIIKLENGKISYGAKIYFEKMYGGELEVGVAEFYRDGALVSTQPFTSDATSGDYAANFKISDGGFDMIIIKAKDNGNSFSIKDNSDFTVSGIEFLGTTDTQPISYAEGTISYGFGADGAGSIGFTKVVDVVKLTDGSEVTITNTDNSIIAKDSNGDLVFQVQLTPSTGKWEFYQYKDFLIGDGTKEILDINFKVTDADGDGVEGSINVGVTASVIVPEITLVGSTVSESEEGTATNDAVQGKVTVILNKAFDTDLTIKLSNGDVFVIPKDTKEITFDTVTTSRVDDVYRQGESEKYITIENISKGSSTLNLGTDIYVKYGENGTDTSAVVTVNDDSDTTTVEITAKALNTSEIDVTNVTQNSGFTVKAYDMNGNESNLGTINGYIWNKETLVKGFGVVSSAEMTMLGKNYNISAAETTAYGSKESNAIKATNSRTDGITGTAPEINVSKDGTKSESVVVEFKNEIQSLDVAFAFRNSNETAKVEFYHEGKFVGYATISGGNGSDNSTYVKYYDEKGNLTKTDKTQGGSDGIDKAYTFESGSGDTFNKVVFKGIDAKDSYLINSISYKEVVEENSTTIGDAEQVMFEIQTSNPPDVSKYNFVTTFPTATVEVGDKTYTVNLDVNGRGTLIIDTNGATSLTAKVIEVDGNFEDVQVPVQTTIGTQAVPTADDNIINILEDEIYTLKESDFGDNSQNVAKIKFTDVPDNGTLYVLKAVVVGQIDANAEIKIISGKEYVKIEDGDIVDNSSITSGKVIFIPNENSDIDGSFKFKVSSGGTKDSDFTTKTYETTINVEAVADAPIVTISITPDASNPTTTGNSGNENSGSDTKIERLDFESYLKAEGKTGNNAQDVNGSVLSTGINNVDKTFGNWNNGSVTTGSGNDTLIFNRKINGNVTTGEGDDKVYVAQASDNGTLNLGNGNNEAHFKAKMDGKIIAGSGNDEVRIDGSINKADIDLGAGDNKLYIKNISNGNNGEIKFGDGSDKLVIDGSADNTNISLGSGNNIVSIKGNYGGTITSEDGNDTIIIGGNINNQNSKIDTGAGSDFVQINGEINNQFGKVNLGEGDDGFRYNPTNWNAGNQNAIDGGKGFDTLYLKGNSTDYKVYTKDSSIAGVTPLLDSAGHPREGLYTISWENFVKANKNNEGFANKEFYIMQNNTEDTNRALKVTNFESISFDYKTFGVKEETSTVYKYDITVNVALKDTDGSEKLSDVTIKNIPNGSVLSGKNVTDNKDGSYTVKVDPEKGGELKLSLTSEKELSDTDLNSIKASATSNEVNEKDEITDSATSTSSRELGKNIDLTGLKNILEGQKTGDIDLSKNGSQDKLTLTLDDVLKLSGDDNTIKISGDMFDSVALKNENGNDWTKSQSTITEDNKTFDVYSGSVGDQTVQVKVEQPISDGITN